MSCWRQPIIDDDFESAEAYGDYGGFQHRRQTQGFEDNQLKANILSYDGHMHIKDFLACIYEVEHFFYMMEVSKRKMVKLVGFRLKGEAAVWWDQLENSHQ